MLNFMLFMTRALGLTVALSWSNAATHIMEYIFPPVDGKAAARYAVAYAIITTIVVVIVMVIINHVRKSRYQKHEPHLCSAGHEPHLCSGPHENSAGHHIIPSIALWQPPCVQ